ncbi:LysR family transcriptional regulator [Vibrio sp. WXL103]|uniref:LysR family transcriptional regulator n=1 Tax=Vibrio sp. WXL103 TaxID=3450710 RepID=UPI003EC4C48B
MHTFEQLRAFVAVYESGSYSAAARALKRDRTTIRDTLKNLEDIWGVVLFDVQGRSALPTAASETLYLQTKALVSQNELLLQRGQAAVEQDIAHLTLATNHFVPNAMMVSLEERLLNKFPLLTVDSLHLSRAEALTKIVDGQCDVAILENRGGFYPEKGVTFLQLGYAEFHVYTSPDSPLQALDVVNFVDLRQHTQYIHQFDVQNESLISRFSNNCRQVGSDEMMCDYVSRNGWGAIPQGIACHWERAGAIAKLDISNIIVNLPKISLSLFFRSGSENHHVIGQAIDWIKALAAEQLQ